MGILAGMHALVKEMNIIICSKFKLYRPMFLRDISGNQFSLAIIPGQHHAF